VARLLHPHFVREEEFALPPLGLLAQTEEQVMYPAAILVGQLVARSVREPAEV